MEYRVRGTEKGARKTLAVESRRKAQVEWSTEKGKQRMEPGERSTANAARGKEHGERRKKYGTRRKEYVEWSTEEGADGMEHGQRSSANRAR